MYKGVFKNGQLDLFADEELLFSGAAPLAELWHLATLHILQHFFRDAGDDVAQVKALLLQEWLSPCIAFTQSFEVDAEYLEAAVKTSICQHASFLFEEYCEHLAFASWSQRRPRPKHTAAKQPGQLGGEG